MLKDDVEKQLKAATSEITKLQAEKSKLESGIAAMQAKVAQNETTRTNLQSSLQQLTTQVGTLTED